MNFGPSLEQIHKTLVSAFDGLELSDGRILGASSEILTAVSAGRLPFISFASGSFKTAPWKDFQWSLSWDIPAVLKTQAPAEEAGSAARLTVFDVMRRMADIIGLPLNSDGELTPFNDDSAHLFYQDKITFLCERGAPFLKTVAITEGPDGLCTCNLIFSIETTIGFDERTLKRMKVGVIGVNNAGVGGFFGDNTLQTDGVTQLLFTPDERGFGGYSTQDPMFGAGIAKRDPIPPGGTSEITALRPDETTVAVAVTPYSAALSVGTPTAQLSAIARYQNWETLYVTQQGAWLSDAPGVATISSAGLVTRVSAGSANITCTFDGVVSNTVAVTCS